MGSGIFRVQKTGNYTTVNNEFINDPRISAKAKGILLYLLSKPSNWESRTEDIVAHMADGIDSIKSGLKELQAAGYFVRRKIQDRRGRFVGWETLVYEVPLPQPETPPLEGNRKWIFPQSETPSIGDNRKWIFPQSENPPLLNTNKELNTENKYVESAGEADLEAGRTDVLVGTDVPTVVGGTVFSGEEETEAKGDWSVESLAVTPNPSSSVKTTTDLATPQINPGQDRNSADNFSAKEKGGLTERFERRFWKIYPGTFSTQSKGPKAKALERFRQLLEKGVDEEEVYAVLEWDLKRRQARWDAGQFAESFPHAFRYLSQVEFFDKRRLWKEERLASRPKISSPQACYEPQKIEAASPEQALEVLARIKADLETRRRNCGLSV